jgi:hypothetical protein
MVHVGIGNCITFLIPNCWGYHMSLQYLKTRIKGDDGKTYDVDPVVTVIVCLILHVCARDCFNAENTYNRAISWLTTPGFFVSKNSQWGDVAFMSYELSKCIDNDQVLRKILPRVAENWKTKLRMKSPGIVQSLKFLQPDYIFPDQDTQIILRQVVSVNL